MTSDPPPPGLPYEQLAPDDGLARQWEDGAVAPVTIRGLAMLLLTLPDQTKQLIAEALQEAMGGQEQIHNALWKLRTAKDPNLNGMPNAMILGINRYAPARRVAALVQDLVSTEHARLNLADTRRRDDKLEVKLQVWDLREGWTGDGYDISLERSFSEISKELRISVRSAANHYYGAFELITGHPYSFDNWVTLFHYDKLVLAAGPEALRRRHHRTPISDSGNETVVSAGNQPVDTDSATQEILLPEDCMSVVHDIEILLKQGLDDDQIRAELELPNTQLVRYFRDRMGQMVGSEESET